jgi:hypothetical protein
MVCCSVLHSTNREFGGTLYIRENENAKPHTNWVRLRLTLSVMVKHSKYVRMYQNKCRVSEQAKLGIRGWMERTECGWSRMWYYPAVQCSKLGYGVAMNRSWWLRPEGADGSRAARTSGPQYRSSASFWRQRCRRGRSCSGRVGGGLQAACLDPSRRCPSVGEWRRRPRCPCTVRRTAPPPPSAPQRRHCTRILPSLVRHGGAGAGAQTSIRPESLRPLTAPPSTSVRPSLAIGPQRASPTRAASGVVARPNQAHRGAGQMDGPQTNKRCANSWEKTREKFAAGAVPCRFVIEHHVLCNIPHIEVIFRVSFLPEKFVLFKKSWITICMSHALLNPLP